MMKLIKERYEKEKTEKIDKAIFGKNIPLKRKNVFILKHKTNSEANQIFGKSFIHNNNHKSIIIINNKQYHLKDVLSLKTKSNKIKWKILSNFTSMAYMFYNNKTLCSISSNFSELNTKNVTDMSYSFYGCSSLESLPNISKWNTENVKKMNYLFGDCSSLFSLPEISFWNIKNVISINGIFSNCKSLKEIPVISI